MHTYLPREANEVIDKYLHLPLGGKLVQCPYFKNQQGIRAGLGVYLGKGSHSEIINETQLQASQKGIELKVLSVDKIRGFMEDVGLGIDCSGFIAQIIYTLNPIFVKSLAAIKFTSQPFRSLVSRLRPLENISVKTLTSSKFAQRLNDWSSLAPGDIIRTRKGAHAILVNSVQRAEGGNLKGFTYCHSTSYYGPRHGVRIGEVKIVYLKENLASQDWLEKDESGRNYTYDGLLNDDGENGVYRFNTSPW